MSDEKRFSELTALEELLGSVTPKQAFEIGRVMGIMHKGDAIYIERLEAKIEDQREAICSMRTQLRIDEPESNS